MNTVQATTSTMSKSVEDRLSELLVRMNASTFCLSESVESSRADVMRVMIVETGDGVTSRSGLIQSRHTTF